MTEHFSPWTSMWTQPRPAIRSIVNHNPKFGVKYLATLHALQNFLFFARYISLGLLWPSSVIFLVGVFLSPVLGFLWLYIVGRILRITGRRSGGVAPVAYLKAAAAWSKIPSILSLCMWLILLVSHQDEAFVQQTLGVHSFFIVCILFILSAWSFVLFIQTLREVQNFSLFKAIVNCFVVEIVFSLLFILAISFIYTII